MKFKCKLQFVVCIVEVTQVANTALMCRPVIFTLLITFFQVRMGNSANTAAKGNNVRKTGFLKEPTAVLGKHWEDNEFSVL